MSTEVSFILKMFGRQMGFQMSELPERFVTILTEEGFFSGVNAHVYF